MHHAAKLKKLQKYSSVKYSSHRECDPVDLLDYGGLSPTKFSLKNQ